MINVILASDPSDPDVFDSLLRYFHGRDPSSLTAEHFARGLAHAAGFGGAALTPREIEYAAQRLSAFVERSEAAGLRALTRTELQAERMTGDPIGSGMLRDVPAVRAREILAMSPAERMAVAREILAAEQVGRK